MKLFILFCFFTIAGICITSCKKASTDDISSTGTAYSFSYPDSVLYLRDGNTDYIVQPVQPANGTYTAYPEGIEVDSQTGAINVSKSETGLRYRITFTNDKGQSFTTKVIVSGINYADRYYYLPANDTIMPAIYNADPSRSLPISGSIFDEGNLAKGSGCAMATTDGRINLAASIRNGMFGLPAQYGAATEVQTVYRLNDKSNKAQNGLKVKFYYFRKASDVPQYLLDLLHDRQDMFFRLDNNIALSEIGRVANARPRPPCIIVIAE